MAEPPAASVDTMVEIPQIVSLIDAVCVWESRTMWARALRRFLPQSIDVVSADAICDESWAGQVAGRVNVFEVTAGSGVAVLAAVKRLRRSPLDSVILAVIRPDNAPAAPLLRAAGVIHVWNELWHVPDACRLIERIWQQFPHAHLSLEDQIWKNLPWTHAQGRDVTGLGRIL